jgi:peptide/nickel transport system substrate-binding protein
LVLKVKRDHQTAIIPANAEILVFSQSSLKGRSRSRMLASVLIGSGNSRSLRDLVRVPLTRGGDEMDEPRPLAETVMANELSRRQLLRRAAAMGIAVPAIATLLAACAEDDDTDDTPVAPDDDDVDDVPDEDDTDDVADERDDTQDDDRHGGTMIILGEHEISSLSPDDAGPWVHSAMTVQIFDGLIRMDEMFEPQPELAESWDISEDGLEYTLQLRDDVLFHDREPFTSADARYTYEFHLDPENATVGHGTVATISAIDTPDDNTLVLNFDDPDASFLAFGLTFSMLPEHYHSEIGENVFKSEPMGTGPFMLDEYRPAEFTSLVAFDDHWRGRPYLDGLRMNIVPEGSVRALQIQTGEADSSVSPIGVEDNIELYEDESITTFRTTAVVLQHAALNHTHPPLAEKEIRQAMMYAIDRDQIVDDIFFGFAVKATANLSPAVEFWHNPDVREYEYNPDQAEAMLDEAGWVMGDDGVRERDGEPMHFVMTLISGISTTLAETIQHYLAQVGIDMEIREAPISDIQEGLRDGRVHSTSWQWSYGGWDGEPDSRYTMHSEAFNNWNSWENEEVDELLVEGIQQTDPEARREAYYRVQELVAEEVPMLFLAFPEQFHNFTPRIKGLPDYDVNHGHALYSLAHTFWIEE